MSIRGRLRIRVKNKVAHHGGWAMGVKLPRMRKA